jgi:uncharacterized protein
MSDKIGQVKSCSPTAIVVEVGDLETFENEQSKQRIQVGKYVKIAQGNRDHVIALIRNIRGSRTPSDSWMFELECQAIGKIEDDSRFARGIDSLPVPLEPAYTVDADTFAKIFEFSNDFSFPLGYLTANKSVQLRVNGDKFFAKHVAVVGSTGSGKSCTVARIIQDAVGISNGQNVNAAAQKNAHVVILDIHSEYASAFTLDARQNFTLNVLTIDGLVLPYWLMNSEELESMFIVTARPRPS